jgi:replicative DNA helicase
MYALDWGKNSDGRGNQVTEDNSQYFVSDNAPEPDEPSVSETPLASGLPANVDAERTILGAILLDNAAHAEATERLQPDDFSLDSHRHIFLRMCELMDSQHAVDIVTLSNSLSRNKEIQSVGGVAYLASLTEGLPRRPVIDEYIRIVKDKSLLRKLMVTCSKTIERAADQGESAISLISEAADSLKNIELNGLGGDDLESVGQWLDTNDVFAQRAPGIFTGIDQYDDLTYGFHPEELTIIAARTSQGKTSMACTLAWSIARSGKSVAIFLNEQRKSSFMGRMLCGRSGVSFKSYLRGQLDYVEKNYIQEAIKEFKILPIFWDERSNMSLSNIRGKSRRLHRSGDLDIVLVDQLSGISNEGVERKMRTDEKLGFKAHALKDLSMDLKIPVILFHQLSRETVKNEDSRPGLQNLKNSGELEEIADVVSFLHRPSYCNHKDDQLVGKDEWMVAKNRDGPTGIAQVTFIPECVRWGNRT